MTRTQRKRIDEVIESFCSDLANFADPATEVTRSESVVRWQQDRERREVSIRPSQDQDILLTNKGTEYPRKGFFASHHMADLRRLAEDVRRTGACPRTRAFLAALDPPLEARRPETGREESS